MTPARYIGTGRIALGLLVLLVPLAQPTLAQTFVGTAAWEPRGDTRCVWLPAGPRAVEISLNEDAAAGVEAMLVLDRQHAFGLKLVGDRYAATSLESTTDSKPGLIVLPGSGVAGFADLDFGRHGDACSVRIHLLALKEITDEAEVNQERQRLIAVARVSRRMTEGVALRQKRDPKAALVAAQEAIDLANALLGSQEPLTAAAADHLGSVYWMLGRYSEASATAQSAIAVFTRLYGPDEALTLNVRKNLALYVWELGDLDGSRQLFEQLRPTVLKRFGERSNASLAMTANLAALYQELGEVGRAVEMLSFVYLAREARDGQLDRRTLLVLNNLANALRDAGRIDEALALHRLSYDRYRLALGDRDPDTLRAQHNLGSEGCRLEEPLGCKLLADAALVKAEVLGPDHPETLFSRANLGVYLLRRGLAAEALPELQAVYLGRAKAMSERHWWTVLSRVQLDSARARVGDQAGLPDMRGAVADLDLLLGPYHERSLGSWINLAWTCEAIGDTRCYRETLETVVMRAESDRGQTLLRRPRQADVLSQLVRAYRSLALLQAAEGDSAAAVLTLERSKARPLLASIGLRNAELLTELPKVELDRLTALERRLAALADERGRTREPQRLAELELAESRLAIDAEAIRADWRKRFPKYGSATQVDVPPVAVLAKALAVDEVFVGYAAVPDGFVLYAVEQDGTTHVKQVRFEKAREAIEAWRSVVGTVDKLRVWQRPDGSLVAAEVSPTVDAREVPVGALADELSQRLLTPLRAQLAKSSRWIVSPDGVLATLPFETLTWQGQPLAATHEVRYVQSLAIYRLLRARPTSRTSSLFAMGAPTFAAGDADNARAQLAERLQVRGLGARAGSSETGQAWPPLPGTEREVRAVAALFPDAALYIGDQASEDTLRQMNDSGQLARFRYLLFATHGVLSTESPALSAIVLRQPGSPSSDGYVTAAEWTGYRLRSDLIVMSACETGLGRQVDGQGVMGLPYALFIAGNRNTLLSLWKVPDQSTSDFMVRFFRKLRTGMPQSRALAQTRREMAADPRYADPVHWAGFVLYGS